MSVAAKTFDLRPVREAVMGTLHDLEDRAGPFGCYRSGRKRRPDLYSSLDAALIRVIMGEDFGSSLTVAARKSWVDHVNSYARRYYIHQVMDHTKIPMVMRLFTRMGW